MNKFMEDWTRELDDLEVNLSLGEEEIADAFEAQKSRMKGLLDEATKKVEGLEMGEKTKGMQQKIDELRLQLALGRAETRDAMEAQRKNLASSLHQVESEYAKVKDAAGDKAKEMSSSMGDGLDRFKTQLDMFRLHFHLGQAEAKEEMEEKRNELKEKVRSMKASISEKTEEAEDKWDGIGEELGEAYGHFKSALSKMFSRD